MNLSHHRMAARAAILLMAFGVTHAARAGGSDTGTWRCGNTYTDQPCKDGRPLNLDDARDAAQKHAADDTTREARNAADRLERDRLRQESALAHRRAVLIEDPRRPALQPESRAGAAKTRKGKKDADYFSASGPSSTANKKTAKATRRKSTPEG